MIAAKALIDAGTCETVAANSNCGDDAISYFKDFEYNGERVIVSSGIPDHEAEHDMLVSNPNTRCEHWQFMVVPLSQSQASSSATTGLGVVGLSTTGGHFFNHLSNPDGSLALTNEGPTLDSCFGHSAGSGLSPYSFDPLADTLVDIMAHFAACGIHVEKVDEGACEHSDRVTVAVMLDLLCPLCCPDGDLVWGFQQ